MMIREVAIFLIGVILLIIIIAVISNNSSAKKVLNDTIKEDKNIA